METGEIAAKDACPQCYHPPVFYLVSAVIGKIVLGTGLDVRYVMKLIQFSCCLYGILTLYVIYLILSKMNISDFSRAIAFGTVCFLPRHIYMSAMNSNDAISYLFVSLCVYLMLLLLETNLKYKYQVMLSVAVIVAVFIKYTCYILLPAFAVLSLLLLKSKEFPRKKLISFALLSYGLPALLLCGYSLYNYNTYGTFLPDNVAAASILKQPQDPGGVNFFTFKPWLSIQNPFLAPGKLGSFWTLIYSSTWYDIDAMFIRFFDNKESLWEPYYDWLKGYVAFPDPRLIVPHYASNMGAVLVTLGLMPLCFTVLGFFIAVKNSFYSYTKKNEQSLSEWYKTPLFIMLALFNIALIVAFTVKRPFYSSIKSSYILNALPAYAIFLSFGIMSLRKFLDNKYIAIFFGSIFIFVIIHINYIVYHIGIFNY